MVARVCAALQVSMKKLIISGRLRLTLTPLLKDMPFVGTIQQAFMPADREVYCTWFHARTASSARAWTRDLTAAETSCMRLGCLGSRLVGLVVEMPMGEVRR